MTNPASRWMIGDIRVDRIAEIEGPLFRPQDVFPDFDPEVLEAHRDTLVPAHFSPELGVVIGTIQTYVIRTAGMTVLVDTCCGNDKQRPGEPFFHNLQTPYIERLSSLGLRPDDVDFVLCTHLHVDHVGWNTKLENGQWVPTFPNAVYLFSQPDLDDLTGVAGPQYADCIEPIIASRRADLLTCNKRIAPGLNIEFAPGHTPGHLILRVHSRNSAGLFVGDVVQHPIQVFRPDWNSRFCASPQQARATRHRVLGECADEGSTMFPAHFANPYAFKIRRLEKGFGLGK